MKLSVSLPDYDVEVLDRFAEERGTSRSAALRHAVRLLREEELGDQYEQAWAESGVNAPPEDWGTDLDADRTA